MTENLKSQLMELGLSEREAKLYLAMLNHPDRTALELQDLADVPRTKVYEILTRMVERQLCAVHQVDTTKRYSAVDPRQIIEAQRAKMTDQLRQMEGLKDNLTQIYDRRESSTV